MQIYLQISPKGNMKIVPERNAPKGHGAPSQGNALGTSSKGNFRPERAKALIFKAFALSGR
jgi:hypothetical protein